MRVSTLLVLPVLACMLFGAIAKESEEPQRTQFRAAYNGQRAEQRLMAIDVLEASTEQPSIETLYFVSVRDPDPEVRSRAFDALVHCSDTYGYTAHLAADSFRQEKEFGVKVEKGVELGNLHYKWAALNELTAFLSTLRWNYWNWHSYARNSGYIPAGTPPETPSTPINSDELEGAASPPSAAAVASAVAAAEVKKTGQAGYERWKNRKTPRWRSENELMGLIAGTINRISGAQVDAVPRVDQEIVKWWERKSELWMEYDRKLRTEKLPKWKDVKFANPRELKVEGIQPGKDTLRDLLETPAKAEAAKKVNGVREEDE